MTFYLSGWVFKWILCKQYLSFYLSANFDCNQSAIFRQQIFEAFLRKKTIVSMFLQQNEYQKVGSVSQKKRREFSLKHPAAKIECAHRRAGKLLTDYNHRILTFHSIYDCLALLNAFNTNTLNFHQYFKRELFSHQTSHRHNTRHRTNNNFNTPLFNRSKSQNLFLYRLITIWNSLPKFA